MRWPDEIRDPSELLPPPVELTDEEIDGALALMVTMTRDDLDDEEFRDTYTEALGQIIEAKREHREPPKLQEPEAKPGEIVDLMAALNASVREARASRGEDADVHEMTTKKATKKQPAKKAAKKTARKSEPRKKSSA
jgi:DNA end-binding protein Ku